MFTLHLVQKAEYQPLITKDMDFRKCRKKGELRVFPNNLKSSSGCSFYLFFQKKHIIKIEYEKGRKQYYRININCKCDNFHESKKIQKL